MDRTHYSSGRRQQKLRRRAVTMSTLVLVAALVAGCTVMKSKPDPTPNPTPNPAPTSEQTTAPLLLPADATGGAQVGVELRSGQPVALLQKEGAKWVAAPGVVKVDGAQLHIEESSKGPVVVRAGSLPTRDPFVVKLQGANVVPAAGGEPTYQAWAMAGGKLQPADYYEVMAPKPAAPTAVMVDKGLNALWLFKDGKLVFTKRVATGRYLTAPYPTAQNQANNSVTPVGTFTIGKKIENPIYYHDNVAGGDPKNPLGTRFMGFSVYQGDGAGVWAIHGTNEPNLIGQWVSDGCVRMYTKDAEALFAQVDVGTPVVIFDSVHKG